MEIEEGLNYKIKTELITEEASIEDEVFKVTNILRSSEITSKFDTEQLEKIKKQSLGHVELTGMKTGRDYTAFFSQIKRITCIT